MSNKIYKNAIVNGHTYSRQPLAAGQKFLDQMSARAGHHINENEVRGDIIPEILSIQERNEKFLIYNGYGQRIVGGPVGSKYAKIIQFTDYASLQEIPNTNGESFQVIDNDGNPLTNFIDPSDKPITTTKLSDGYTIRLLAEDKTTEISINYGWTINTLNGIVHFAPDFKPGSEDWINQGFGDPVLEGFIYIGKYTSDNLEKVSTDIKITQESLEEAINSAIAIQPFKFSTGQMEKIGPAYPKELSPLPGGKYEMYQRLTFIVPGYCFELTALDTDETIITEMRHLQSGDTQIFLDLPWNTEYDKPIIQWEYEDLNHTGVRFPVLGKYSFLATTFVKNNGKKINVKNIIDFDDDSFQGLTINPYTYISEYEEGWRVPAAGSIVEGGDDSVQSDSSVNVNINLN